MGTNAKNLPQLIEELGVRRFGHRPRVGDAFCGGGSIPFEAARIGCDAYGSDLNPVAALLTWSALNLIGGSDEARSQAVKAQEKAFAKADAQITKWGIEHNSKGWRADVFLYCFEAISPATGFLVPLAPSWVISEKNRVCAVLKENKANKNYDISIIEDATDEQMEKAKSGTVQNGKLVCPKTGETFSISGLRGDNRSDDGKKTYGLRMWENNDLVPREKDVFQERLYCIRWVETLTEGKKQKTERHYRSVTTEDVQREQKVVKLLEERFSQWQKDGIIPSEKIESGYNTDQPIRERGWTYWHHLFNPRQLLVNGCLSESICGTEADISSSFLLLNRVINRNSRLCRWQSSRDQAHEVFDNQALNTNYNYSCRAISYLNFIDEETADSATDECWFVGAKKCELLDARDISQESDIWITDPPYADAVNYHELTNFSATWLRRHWKADTRSNLAIKGSGNKFRESMIDVYKILNEFTATNGIQVVMFTHQDASVWADLCLILWASGLEVVNAWCISTETAATGIKQGNYVQGTVCLMLKRRDSTRSAFLDELFPDVEREVKSQVELMQTVEDTEDPNFSDTDYQLCAYAAALRVMTGYGTIEDLNVSESATFDTKNNPVVMLIEQAVKIASEQILPTGFTKQTWRKLGPMERFYLKGIDLEAKGEKKNSAFQELARSLGSKDYATLLQSGKANDARLFTASELKRRELESGSFGGTHVRNCLFAIYEAVKEEKGGSGLSYLKQTLVEKYWDERQTLVTILRYIANRSASLPHWSVDSDAAKTIAGLLERDSV